MFLQKIINILGKNPTENVKIIDIFLAWEIIGFRIKGVRNGSFTYKMYADENVSRLWAHLLYDVVVIVLLFNPLMSTAFPTSFLIGSFRDICILVTNHNPFSKNLGSFLILITTVSYNVSDWFKNGFFFTNRPVVLRGETCME